MNLQKQPLISVIIATYKRPHFIGNAIRNVLDQTYSNIEIIVVDDNGIDTPEQLETYFEIKKFVNKKVTYFALKKNFGSCYARNYGVKESSGQFLSFFDDDDYWDNRKLELQLGKFINNLSLGFVYCFEKVINAKNGKILSESQANYGEGDIYKDYLNLRFGVIRTPNPLVLREAFQNVNGFDVNQTSGNDFDFFIRIAKKYPVGLIPEYLHFVNIHNEGRITTNHLAKVNGKKQLLEKYGKNFDIERKVFINKQIIAHSFRIKDCKSAKEASEYVKSHGQLPLKYKIFMLGINNIFFRLFILGYFKIRNIN